MTKNTQKIRRLKKRIREQKTVLNHAVETGLYNKLNTSLSTTDFQFAIILFHIGSTILFYNEKYIRSSSRDEGQGNKLKIWDYLCKMDNNDNVLNNHRRKLGFPIDEQKFPTLSSRQLQCILSGETNNQNTQKFIKEFYTNENFKVMLSEWQHTSAIGGMITQKNMNKLEDIIEHFEYNNIFPKLDKKSQVELKKIKDFTNWRIKNPDDWNKIVNELH